MAPEATTKRNGNVEWEYNELIARDGQTFVFIDKVFYSTTSSLHGATGSRMMPVTQEEMDHRRDEMRDFEYSPLGHIYEEVETTKSWDEWIDEQLRLEGGRLLYDPSYECKYGPMVRSACGNEHDEGTPDPWLPRIDDIVVVECIGGGRMFHDVTRDYDVIYNQELLATAKDAEEGLMPDGTIVGEDE